MPQLQFQNLDPVMSKIRSQKNDLPPLKMRVVASTPPPHLVLRPLAKKFRADSNWISYAKTSVVAALKLSACHCLDIQVQVLCITVMEKSLGVDFPAFSAWMAQECQYGVPTQSRIWSLSIANLGRGRSSSPSVPYKRSLTLFKCSQI